MATRLLLLAIALQDITGEATSITLWQGKVPNGPGPSGPERTSSTGSHTNISKPHLIVHRPKYPNGSAMLVISGGGYAHIEMGKESTPAAKWLQSKGVIAFELVYRLPAENWSSVDVPFQDGQRAMRLIRQLSSQFKFDANKIGIMGFSAGGHLAGTIETEPDKTLYAPTDEADQLSARPNFAALLYPVITMLSPFNDTHAEKEILGKNPNLSQQKKYSVQLHVNSQTAPTFLAQALDDPISNVENSKLMYESLQNHNVTTELHLFKTGGHGWGLGAPGSPEQAWPELFQNWAKINDFF